MRGGAYILNSEGMLQAIREDFNHFNKDTGFVLVAFVPESNKHATTILSQAEHWNRLSGETITILFAGYYGLLSRPGEPYLPLDGAKPLFDDDEMKDVAKYFQSRTKWRYAGKAQFFGCAASVEEHSVEWDFRKVVSFSLEDLGSNFDINRFVSELIDKSSSGRFSPDQDIVDVSIKRIKAALRALAPKPVKEFADALVETDYLAPKDLRKTHRR
jgi:hypothetical protein